MNEPRLWERLRKFELAMQKICIDLPEVGEELRTAEESQIQEPKEKNEK